MPNKIVILNGPPGCGKDTLANELIKFDDVIHCEMKDKLFQICLTVSGIGATEWFNRYNDRDLKDKGWAKLGGLSQRQFMIKVSEEWIKPLFGDWYFGKQAADTVNNYTSRDYTFVFSDGGFEGEINALRAGCRNAEIHVVQLYGRGTWGNDSRSYISPEHCTIHQYNLTSGMAGKDAFNIAKIVRLI